MKKLLLTICLLFILGCNKSREENVNTTSQSLVLPTVNEEIISTAFGEPWGKSVGDVNGDGLPDLLVQGRNSGGLIAFLGPNWTPHTIASSGNFSTDLEVGDMDNDGDSDVVTINTDGLVIYFQTSPGNWSPNQIISGISLHDVEVADLDNDGNLDIVARNQGAFSGSGSPIRVFTNNGFWTQTQITTNDGEGLVVADVNADNLPDIVVARTWYNNADNWAAVEYAPSGYIHAKLALGDINDDGRIDIASAPAELENGTDNIVWYEAPTNPLGVWTEHSVKSIETTVHSLEVGDFNNDGAIDIIYGEMSQSDQDRVAVLFQDGASWSEFVFSTSGTHQMRCGDFDLDGDLDCFGANWRANGSDEDVKLWRNQLIPDSPVVDQWQRFVVDNAKPSRSLWIGDEDMNNDGLKDLVSGPYLYLNPGSISGSWTRQALGSDLNNAVAIVTNRNGESFPGVLASEGNGSNSDGTFSYGINDGTGSFTVLNAVAEGPGDFLQGFSWLTPTVGAMSWHQAGNGVQLLDINTWNLTTISSFSEDEALSTMVLSDETTVLFQGSGFLYESSPETWTRVNVASFSQNPDRNVPADIDLDGDLDVVVGFDATTTPLVWLEQPANPFDPWPVHTIATSLGGGYSLDVCQNTAGLNDVVLGEHRGARRVLYFENLGDGSAWEQHVVHDGIGADDHHVGTQCSDLDNDGDLDIYSNTWDGSTLIVFENLAINSTSTNTTSTTGTGGSTSTTTDSTSTTSSTSTTGGSGTHIPQDGLMSYWSFDEGSGNIAADSIGSHDGAITNAAWVPDSQGGTALSFNGSGSSSHVAVGTWNLTGSAMTIAAWIRPISWQGNSWDNRIISKANGDSEQNHWFMLSGIKNNNEPKFRVRLKTDGDTDTFIFGNLGTGDWVHTAVTYDDPEVCLYVDAVQVGCDDHDTGGPFSQDSSIPVEIGRNPDGKYAFNGDIDEVLIYNRALSPGEISDLQSGTPPVNEAPQANAGTDQSILISEQASLNGTASDDGLPFAELTTTWGQVSGPGTASFGNVNQLQTTVSFDLAGTYTLRLLADDGELASTDDVIITVTEPVNEAPQVNAGTDQSILISEQAFLTGSATDDGLPSSVLNTVWSQVSGPDSVTFGNASLLSTTASFNVEGTYVLRLTADDGALSTSDDITITVNLPEPEPPVASFVTDSSFFPVSYPLNASASFDPDGSIVSWEWDCGNNTAATGEVGVCVYSAPGSFVVTLTVTDSQGLTTQTQQLREVL